MRVEGKNYRTVWMDGSDVCLIDQRILPHKFQIFKSHSYKETARAIKDMVVRGAGAIGATAGYAMAQAALKSTEKKHIEEAANIIRNTRPTAQNLFYAVNRVLQAIHDGKNAVEEAQRIADEDVEQCRAIGEHGLELIEQHGGRISTHCNAGWLAFVDYGSALAPVYTASRKGLDVFVYVDETRPRSQGGLTAWELQQEGLPFIFVTDNDATHFRNKEVDLVIVGADRIARNGDVANKIGTYQRALVAKDNEIPFYVAAPLTTIDLECKSGEDIPIEERSPEEVLYAKGLLDDEKISRVLIPPKGTPVKNPA